MAVPAPDLSALRLLGDRVRPLSGAGERILSVPDAFVSILPQGGLQRGTVVATGGVAASSLALALAGPVTATGSWVAMMGLEQMGLLAAAELGVDLERVLLIANPGAATWAATVATLLDAVELVLVRPPRPVAAGVQRRLGARARERGSVLIQVGGHTGAWATAPDLVVSATSATWSGLGVGHGHLKARRVNVAVTGRRGADRPRCAELWLPGPNGEIARVAPVVAPVAVPPVSVPQLREVG